MSFIGIDPAYAKPVAAAFPVGQGKSRRSWALYDLDPNRLIAELPEVWTEAKDSGVTGVILEGGFIGVNPQVGMKLEGIREVIKQSAEASQLPVTTVAPATWQAALLCQGRWHPKTHDEIIQQVEFRVKHIHKIEEEISEDRKVAICLSEWGENLMDPSRVLTEPKQ